MESIVLEIKDKPELKGLPNSLVEKSLKEFLSKHKITLTDSLKERKIIIKEVRRELRRYAGQYASKSNIKNRDAMLAENKIMDLLSSHSSTRERKVDYEEIKEIINNLNPKSILDLGCGLNPIAIANPKIEYYAYDIKQEDLDVIKEFFKKESIHGEVFNEDIRVIEKFPRVDLCLIFKVLDILGDNRNQTAKRLLTTIQTKHFLVSFATRTLSGKPMNSPYRRWFENVLEQLQYPYTVKRMKQELVYLIEKS